MAILLALSAGCATGKMERPDAVSLSSQPSANAININAADHADLERIPHVGPALAAKIIEFRNRKGPFKKAEHLMLVEGISDERFRKIRHLVKAE